MGVSTIPRDIFNTIKTLKGNIDAKINTVLNKVFGAIENKLNKYLTTVGVGQQADYKGLVGSVMTFKVGTETHRLWAVVDKTGKGYFMLASNPDKLSVTEAGWTEQAKTNPTLKTLLDAEQKSVAGIQVSLNAVAADVAQLKQDLVAPPNETPQQKAARDAKVKADIKKEGASEGTFKGNEGQDQPQGPSGTPTAAVQTCMGAACFVEGTPMLVPGGSKAIEELRVGDLILSRSEFDPNGPIQAKVVEEVFIRTGRVLHLHLGGQVIGTTSEHPFFVEGRGWVPAGHLQPGNRVATLSGEWCMVEEGFDTGLFAKVYNLRIADHHTYFVGEEHWGFAAWAHNAYLGRSDPALRAEGEGYAELAAAWWRLLPAGENGRPGPQDGSTVALTKVGSKTYVALYANLGNGPRQYTQDQIDAFVRSVTDSGAMAIVTQGQVHAEMALHQQVSGCKVIGISNPSGPCNRECKTYFEGVSFFNIVWPGDRGASWGN